MEARTVNHPGIYRSVPVSDMPATDKLIAAIGILQAHILASDSVLDAERLFGTAYEKRLSLEVVESLLQDLVGAIQDTRQEPEPDRHIRDAAAHIAGLDRTPEDT